MALQRGRTGIQLMQKFGLITADAAKGALGESLPALPQESRLRADLSHTGFLSLVLHQLDLQFTEQRVRRGGLAITTTLDYGLQLQTSCTTSGDAVLGLASCPADQPPLNQAGARSAAIILDPQTGQVLAADDSSGAASFLVPHDAGTLLTPFVYLTAFTRGFGPGSLVWDIPSTVSADAAALGSSQSEVENLKSEIYHGPVRMRIALANDYLAAAQQVAAQMGSDAVRRTEASFGLDGSQESPAAGPQPTLLDLASAYAVFAANGVRYGSPLPSVDGQGMSVAPTAVLRLEGLDHSLWLDLSNPQAQPIVSPALAYLVNNVLTDESARWPTLGHPNDLEIGRPAGVKLGRSTDGSGTWGIGYTPSRLVAVWNGTQPPSEQLEPPSAAANPPPTASSEPLLSSLLQLAVQDQPADGWAVPPDISTVVVCDPSGLLPTSDCPTTVSEVFLSGNEPAQADTLFRTYTVNRETGLLATVFTPPQLVQDKVFMVVPTEAADWAKAAGIAVAPSSYDAIQAPPVDPNVHISTPALFSDVTGKVQFRGTASGANFDHYRVVIGKGLNPLSWTVVNESSSRIEDGLLGAWDTSGLSGLYAVELQVIRTDQQIDTAITQLTVK
jgi:membrane peptidoglycan carboxypeptidase